MFASRRILQASWILRAACAEMVLSAGANARRAWNGRHSVLWLLDPSPAQGARPVNPGAACPAVGCSLGAIRQARFDERRPSPEMAERLAAILDLVHEARVAFLKVARAERSADYLVAPAEQVDHVASLLARW